jgi:membrane protease YdiL (CAAX protease family)
MGAVSVILLGLALNIVIEDIIKLTKLDELFTSYDIEDMIASGSLFLRVLAIGIIGPVAEELCLRGVMYNRLKSMKMSALLAGFLSSLVFGIVHLNIFQGLYVFVLGMVLVYVYEKFKTLLAPVLLHMAFNMLSVLFSEITVSSTADTIMAVAGVLVICVLSAVNFRASIAKKSESSKESHEL